MSGNKKTPSWREAAMRNAANKAIGNDKTKLEGAVVSSKQDRVSADQSSTYINNQLSDLLKSYGGLREQYISLLNPYLKYNNERTNNGKPNEENLIRVSYAINQINLIYGLKITLGNIKPVLNEIKQDLDSVRAELLAKVRYILEPEHKELLNNDFPKGAQNIINDILMHIKEEDSIVEKHYMKKIPIEDDLKFLKLIEPEKLSEIEKLIQIEKDQSKRGPSVT